MRSNEHAEVQSGTIAPVPTWLVSTAHAYMQRVSAKEGIRLPYGVQHARQVGSRLTACGLAAIGWELFWDQSFPDRSTSPCPECVHVVARTETYPRGWLPPS
ncbi:hypothetical protein JCM18899A_52830 [Nocardioides sp. AN3]